MVIKYHFCPDSSRIIAGSICKVYKSNNALLRENMIIFQYSINRARTGKRKFSDWLRSAKDIYADCRSADETGMLALMDEIRIAKSNKIPA